MTTPPDAEAMIGRLTNAAYRAGQCSGMFTVGTSGTPVADAQEALRTALAAGAKAVEELAQHNALAEFNRIAEGVTKAALEIKSMRDDVLTARIRELASPIPMVLHCPSCGLQHVDAPSPGWDNPPHRSHLCHGCGTVWRPADVATVGVPVSYLKTKGVADTWPPKG